MDCCEVVFEATHEDSLFGLLASTKEKSINV